MADDQPIDDRSEVELAAAGFFPGRSFRWYRPKGRDDNDKVLQQYWGHDGIYGAAGVWHTIPTVLAD